MSETELAWVLGETVSSDVVAPADCVLCIAHLIFRSRTICVIMEPEIHYHHGSLEPFNECSIPFGSSVIQHIVVLPH